MLQRAERLENSNGLVDQFDSPFLHDAFVRAGDGRITPGPVQTIPLEGYRPTFEASRSPFALGAKILRVWSHGYGPLGGFYLDPSGSFQRTEAAFHMALDEAVQQAQADLIVWPYFPLESREYIWLRAWLEKRIGAFWGSQVASMQHHARAFLDARKDQQVGNSGFAGLSISRNKRKTMGRQSRRLAELGQVRFLSTEQGLPSDVAIDTFLKTEASGWKAHKGTALAVNDVLSAFAHDFMPPMLAAGQLRVDLMMLDDHCISALVSFRAGRGLFTWKTGMDEVYKRFSPGVHILHEISQQALADPKIDYVDSLADEGHPVAEHLWAGRRHYAQLLVPLNRFGVAAAQSYRAAAVSKDGARYWAKRLLGRD